MNDDKYLKIVKWADLRYRKHAHLIIWEKGQPTRYKLIEMMAWKKYINSRLTIGG